MRPFYYKLLGKLAVPVDDIEDWALTWQNDRHIAHTVIADIRISTIFLGIDMNHAALIDHDDEASPILFETMIFPTENWDDYQTRCATYDQAINMHNIAVALVRQKLKVKP